MRRLMRSAAACLVIGAGGIAPAADLAPATGAAPTADTARPRIVVAFANPPHEAPAPPGSTGSSRYGGEGYGGAQSARQQARQVARAYALREVASWPIQLLAVHCVVFEITDGRPVTEVLAALSRDARVVLAQPLQEFRTLTDTATTNTVYNDPLYDLQTNLGVLGIARAHQRTQGAGVHVALIDTAVDAGHPDLHERIARSRSFVSQAAAGRDALRHGTAVAGVIAAVANNHIGIVGIAPLAQLEVYAACWQLAPGDDAAVCNTFTLAQALAAALASGAPLINLSLAGPADPLLTALVQTGLKRGVIFVGAAAGPDAPFPTAIPGVIIASGSDPPPPAGALAAPARHVLTLRPGGEYDFESGSSVAAAEISGVIALLIAASPARLSSTNIVALLEQSSVARGAAAVVDAGAALARLDAGAGHDAVAARARH